MAFPPRYRLLGQQTLSFKINGLLTEPITDLWTSFFDGGDTLPKTKKSKSDIRIEKSRRRVTQLKASIARTATRPCVVASSTPHYPNSQSETEALADTRPNTQSLKSKLSQLSKESEFEIELLSLDLHESLWKAQTKIARLKLDNRALRTELCSIKGTDETGGIGVLPLMRENRSLRMRIMELESCNKTLLLRETPFDDPKLGWKCHPKVEQHVAENICITKQEFRESFLGRNSSLAEIGLAIRSRWMEQQRRSGKNMSTIMPGNEAAHHGYALADSWLYHPDYNDGRNDIASCIEQYGMSPQRVYQLRGCKALMTLLSWYGSVKSFYGSKNFPKTAFAKAWPPRFFEMAKEISK